MQSSTLQNTSTHKWLYFFISLAVLVNFSGLFVPLMDPDAGVYASISKNMLLRNDYFNLWFQDADWLDKPHFPFWITALFFKLFGIYDWSYKLPGILFALLGAWYTYVFAKKYYNRTIALWAVFILFTAEHFMISNNDVRAEPFLTGLIIASVYHFSNSLSKNLSWQLVAACLFAACCVMTKGVFTLIPIGGAVAGELIIKKEWKQIFHWRWLVALVLVIVFISPELYSLWYQFDSHPEKILFGKTNVSGIRFFLWDSQFGRFMNKGPIKGKGDPTYFLHTLLWAFLPWSLILYVALFTKIKNAIKKIATEFSEWYTISGSLLTLLVFSVSKFQLPYYSNIIFPFLAIISATFIVQLLSKNNKLFQIIQFVISILLVVAGVSLAIFYKPSISIFLIVVLLLMSLLLAFLLIRRNSSTAYFLSGFSALMITLFLNLSFYPDLLKYQSGTEAAFYINQTYPDMPVATISIYTPAGGFYIKDHLRQTTLNAVNKREYSKGLLLFVTEEELQSLEEGEASFEIIKEFKHFHVTMLKLKFLNASTREQVLEKRFLIKLL